MTLSVKEKNGKYYLIKSKGEGSRGGRIIGHTRTGKPIYDKRGRSGAREPHIGEDAELREKEIRAKMQIRYKQFEQEARERNKKRAAIKDPETRKKAYDIKNVGSGDIVRLKKRGISSGGHIGRVVSRNGNNIQVLLTSGSTHSFTLGDAEIAKANISDQFKNLFSPPPARPAGTGGLEQDSASCHLARSRNDEIDGAAVMFKAGRIILKGKGYPKGTVRTWKGKKYIKEDRGWKLYSGQRTSIVHHEEVKVGSSSVPNVINAPSEVNRNIIEGFSEAISGIQSAKSENEINSQMASEIDRKMQERGFKAVRSKPILVKRESSGEGDERFEERTSKYLMRGFVKNEAGEKFRFNLYYKITKDGFRDYSFAVGPHDWTMVKDNSLVKAASRPISERLLRMYARRGESPAELDAKIAQQPIEKNPTEQQKESGKYAKPKINLHGLYIAIENPRGSTRSGVGSDGKRWESIMAHHYGEILRNGDAADGDLPDVFIGPHPESEAVFVINQTDPKTGKFDEHKIMLGFQNRKSAKQGYLDNYEDGWEGIGTIAAMTVNQLKSLLQSGEFQKDPIPTDGIYKAGICIEKGRLILKAQRRSDGEEWTQPSGRRVKKVGGKIVPAGKDGIGRTKAIPSDKSRKEKLKESIKKIRSKLSGNLAIEIMGEIRNAMRGFGEIVRDSLSAEDPTKPAEQYVTEEAGSVLGTTKEKKESKTTTEIPGKK